MPSENALRHAKIDLTEFRLSWRILILGLFGVCTSMSAALLYGFGTMIIPLQNAFGWERGELQTAITFLFAGVAIASQLLGWLYARFGLKRVAVYSVIIQIIGYVALTQISTSILWLYSAFFIMPLLCAGTIAITWTQLINLWYHRNRGLALATILSGTGLAALTMPPLLAWVMELWGWQAGFLLLATIPLLTTLPMAVFWLKLPEADASRSATENKASKPAAVAQGVLFAEAVRSRTFWLCNLALILSVSLIVGMVTVTVPLLQDKGLSPVTAGQVFSAFGASTIFGRLLVGYLLDRFSPILISAMALFMPVIGCSMYLFAGADDITLLVLATLCVGFSAGAEFDIAAFLVARYFGLKDYARIFGLHLGLVTIVGGLSPAVFGYVYTRYGNYDPVLLYSLIAALVASLTLLSMKPAAAYQHHYQPEPT